MNLPILYSFRRCPYAMRARMSIVRSGFQVEHREVVLRDRPTQMMEISPKGTVPVLLLSDGTVIEESLEIMEHVLSWTLTNDERELVRRNDEEFKFHLDRYKYPNRYKDIDVLEERDAACKFIESLERDIPNGNLSDAIFPFVRQFANNDREWFDEQNWPNVHKWLAINLESKEFSLCMTKHNQWVSH
ncbi:MAG: glutathione S-transferase [Candidatus Poseidoniales archaeon]|nr:MAG: glutathione S-transferase [Candidatus Poseidoniales archaeon]